MATRQLLALVVVGALALTSAARGQIIAGVDPVEGNGNPDGWTNILYINEETPLDFTPAGSDHGVLTTFNFWVADSRVEQGVVTPLIAEPISDDPFTGDDYIVRAIGTTREAGTDWQCGGLYSYPFHDTETFVVQNDWVAGFISSDPEGLRDDAMSPIPFVGADLEGWLTGTNIPGSGLPAIAVGQPIEEGTSGTDDQAYGRRQYQFQIQAVAGDVKPQLPAGGRVDGECAAPPEPPDFYAGVHPVTGDGGPDGWTNILYINEETPFDFSSAGASEGVLDQFNFWVADTRVDLAMLTPFVAEPLVENPLTGDDYVVRAIGTTREAGTDWTEAGYHSVAFHDSEQFTVQDGWVAGFLSSDPEGFSPDAASPIPFVGNAGVEGWLTGTNTPGSGAPAIAVDEPIQEGESGTQDDAYGLRRYQFQITAQVGGGTPRLQAGDADQNLEFNQLDLVKVQIAAKYLTGQPATWGEGDWDGAPGGAVGNPPQGDGVFDQLDIIAALNANVYLKGPYAAISPGGGVGDEQTSIIYDPRTGELGVDAPAGTQLTSINVDSAAGIFTGDPAQNLGGSFDNDADKNIFKATFGSSFSSLSFGNVAQTGLSEDFVLNDLAVVGSLAGGGDLGQVDLIYVPEPASMMLLAFGLLAFLVGNGHGCRRK